MALSKPTFALHGYERFFAMTPGASATLAFVMTIRGDVQALLQHLPMAVLMTFNQHPKMRTALLPGVTPQKAMICPPLVDETELKGIYTCTWQPEDVETSTAWMDFVESECARATHREQELPYRLHVFANQATQRFARLVLFADHYMADAASGAIVLQAILGNAARISGLPTPTAVPETTEHPIRPSLYECMHTVNPWWGVLNEAMAKWVIEPLFNFDHSGFCPALAVDTTTQRDFAGAPPVPSNPSRARFATGTAANMKLALERCEAEGVSLEGALTASMLVAFGLTSTHGELRRLASTAASEGTAPDARIRLKSDVLCDMRGQHAAAFDEGPVGLYSTAGNLVFTSSEGAHINEAFWEVARKADREIEAMRHGHELKLQSVYVHETLHAENRESGLQVKHAVLSDATLANVGIYGFPHEIAVQRKAPGGATATATTTTLHVESLHVYNSLPSLSSACMLFVSGVTSFNYSLMSKLQGPVGDELFHWFVQCVEHLGDVRAHDTLLQASNKLEAFAPSGATVSGGGVPVVPINLQI